MIVDDDGRYLLVWTVPYDRQNPAQRQGGSFHVVRGWELADYLAAGWRYVAVDPCPHFYPTPTSNADEDGA